jgi:uncharacterized membrane protein YeiH
MVLIDILGIIGTVAFAISGVIVAIKNKLDLFGVFLLSIVTAAGGGLIRDIIIGKELPVFFTQPKYLITITLTVIVTCLAFRYVRRLIMLVQIFDAVGLGVFTILTSYKCILTGMPIIGVIFIAVTAGAGGGIIRDLLVTNVPLVLKSEIYILASLIGALSFYLLYNVIDTRINIYLCVTLVFAARILSLYFNWNLPVIRIKEEHNID